MTQIDEYWRPVSQVDAILKHLRSGPITPLDALRDHGCFRLAARINDLRRDGHAIRTALVVRGGKKVAEYRLVDRPQQAEMW